MAPEMDEPEVTAAPAPFQIIGSDDAGYCAHGVCVIPPGPDQN